MGIFRNLAMASAVLSAVAVSAPASAATWSITSVDNGSWGGFGASGFHNTGGGSDGDSNVMTGSSLGGIDLVFLDGLFDDSNGSFTGEFHLSGDTGTQSFTLNSSNMFFGSAMGGQGFLFGSATMGLDLTNASGPLAGLTTTEIGFMGGDICCTGPNRPNSFVIDGGGMTAIMALWGANGFFGTGYSGYDANPGDAIAESSIGLDLRLRLALIPEIPEVPVPASLPLFGTGLALMGYLGWRKKKRKA